MQSIVNGQSAYIDHINQIVAYSSIICGKFQNARIKMANKKFFLSQYGMAFRTHFHQHFKQKIRKL